MHRSISLRKLVQNFQKLGFIGPYFGGKHQFMIKDKLKLIIPNSHKGDISKSLLSEILRQAGISSSDWNKLF